MSGSDVASKIADVERAVPLLHGDMERFRQHEKVLAASLESRAALVALLARVVTVLERVAGDVPVEIRVASWRRRKNDRYLIATIPGLGKRVVLSRTKVMRTWRCSRCMHPIDVGAYAYRPDRCGVERLRSVRICTPCANEVSPVRPDAED